MILQLYRLIHNPEETIGYLLIDGNFECFTLEDQHQEKKVHGETRIPCERYEILLRDEGGMNSRYASRFPELHRGMLWLQDVEGFEWVYIHIGNDDDDTLGCILVGKGVNPDQTSITASTAAYLKLYKKVVDAMDRGEEVYIYIYNV